MLSNEVKTTIQSAYTKFLEGRQLKPRYGQKLMIAEIAKTLGSVELDDEGVRTSDGHICVVEAGTGTGKTVAYLMAAIPIARALGKKLVVSTATIALQEQIVNKDLPELKRQSGLQFNFALAKGRGRYLCLSKLDRLLMEQEASHDPARALYEDELPQVSAEDVKLYQQMVETLAGNQWDGDKDSWKTVLDDSSWQRVTTDHRQCTGRRCSNVSSCSFFKSRDSLGTVDVIVTNHDLVLADLALGGGAILPAPADAIYIFDEGHHLPEKALNHFACHGRTIATTRWLDQCLKSLSEMLGQISGAGNIDRFAEQLPAELATAKRNMELVWPQLQQYTDTLEPDGDNSPRYRFEHGIVSDDLRLIAEALKHSFERLTDLLSRMTREVEDALEDRHCDVPAVDLEAWYPVLGNWQGRAEANLELWASYASADAEDAVPKARWLTLVDTGAYVDIEVCSSPILAAKTLAYSLWQACCGAVVTSATLTALGNFQRFQMRAGTPNNSCYTMVPSPFDFAKAELHIPEEASDASNALAHTRAIIEHLPRLLSKAKGSLILFSSRRQMREVYQGLPTEWQELILMQGEGSKQALISQHKANIDKKQGSILFGLASFAEGLDLPGAYCEHVVIAKIPFSVPDDPVEAALAEWIEKRGGNAFMEITVPDAAIKLVQASGRLLRTETDAGQITIMDDRLLTRRYGSAILKSLPPFKRI